jgi:hypothetical protein
MSTYARHSKQAGNVEIFYIRKKIPFRLLARVYLEFLFVGFVHESWLILMLQHFRILSFE